MPTQISSSPVKPNKRSTPIQTADNELQKRSLIFYCVSESKAEVAADHVRHDKASITFGKAFRVGALDSNSTEMPRPVKIVLGSVEERQLLLNGRKKLNAKLFFSRELPQGQLVERRAAVLQGNASKNGGITTTNVPPTNVPLPTHVAMTGKLLIIPPCRFFSHIDAPYSRNPISYRFYS